MTSMMSDHGEVSLFCLILTSRFFSYTIFSLLSEL